MRGESDGPGTSLGGGAGGVQRVRQAGFAGDDSLSPKKAKELSRNKAKLETALAITQDDLKKFLTYVNKVPKSKEAGGPCDIERLEADQLSLSPVEADQLSPFASL